MNKMFSHAETIISLFHNNDIVIGQIKMDSYEVNSPRKLVMKDIYVWSAVVGGVWDP